MRKLAKEIAILLGLAVCLALTVNFLSPVGIALVGQWDISQGGASLPMQKTMMPWTNWRSRI